MRQNNALGIGSGTGRSVPITDHAGTLTKLDGNTVYLTASKVADPKGRADSKKKADAPKPNKDA